MAQPTVCTRVPNGYPTHIFTVWSTLFLSECKTECDAQTDFRLVPENACNFVNFALITTNKQAVSKKSNFVRLV